MYSTIIKSDLVALNCCLRSNMAKKSVSETVTEELEPIISNLGYELVEVKYAKGRSGKNERYARRENPC